MPLRLPRVRARAHLRAHVRNGTRIVTVAFALATTRTATHAQAVLKVNDTVSVRFGVLLQPWFDASEDPVTGNYAQNIYLRRVRFIAGGQFGSKFSAFLDTENPNLGRAQGTTGKSIRSGFVLLDAYIDYHPAQAFTVQAGLMLPPSARNAMQAAPGLLPIDVGSYAFLNGNARVEDEVAGRDLGVQARGYVLTNRLEYRVGVFQGARQPAATAGGLGAANPLRAAGRLQIAFLDREVVSFLYPGYYFGKKRMFNLGFSYDAQQTLHSITGDVFLEYPVGTLGAITVQGDVFRRDGGQYAALLRQTDGYAEGGFYFRALRVMPFARVETQNISGNAPASQHRFEVGLGYYIAGQNLSLKTVYGQIRPNAAPNTNQFTTQLQFFYF